MGAVNLEERSLRLARGFEASVHRVRDAAGQPEPVAGGYSGCAGYPSVARFTAKRLT